MKQLVDYRDVKAIAAARWDRKDRPCGTWFYFWLLAVLLSLSICLWFVWQVPDTATYVLPSGEELVFKTHLTADAQIGAIVIEPKNPYNNTPLIVSAIGLLLVYLAVFIPVKKDWDKGKEYKRRFLQTWIDTMELPEEEKDGKQP